MFKIDLTGRWASFSDENSLKIDNCNHFLYLHCILGFAVVDTGLERIITATYIWTTRNNWGLCNYEAHCLSHQSIRLTTLWRPETTLPSKGSSNTYKKQIGIPLITTCRDCNVIKRRSLLYLIRPNMSPTQEPHRVYLTTANEQAVSWEGIDRKSVV